MKTRIGNRMIEAYLYVAAHEGCTMLPVADAIGPNGSRKYGYRAVHRAVEAQLINAEKVGSRYVLTTGYSPIELGAR